MAIDAVSACSQAVEQSGPKGFLISLFFLFAAYIFCDLLIAAAVIRKRVWWDQ